MWWARIGSYTVPYLHFHMLPCPYYIRVWRADSLYSRGERGEDVMGWPLWSPMRTNLRRMTKQGSI